MRTRELVTRRLEILFGHDGVIWSVHPDGTRLARIPLDVATGVSAVLVDDHACGRLW
jgi:hypothetical protein